MRKVVNKAVLLRLAPLLTGFAIVLLAGFVHGVWTNRWHQSSDLDAAALRLADLPHSVGDWKGERSELDAQDLAASGAAGYWMQRFTNCRTGAVVTVVLLCGRPGPMSVHRPAFCYRGAGFEVMAPAAKCKVAVEARSSAGFWTGRFCKTEPVGTTCLRILWSWNGGDGWEAADSPRLAFARFPALYKLYLIHEMASAQELLDDDPSINLLRQLLPEWDKVLFSPKDL